jgi:Helix-loop-helix DNA-binding domain
MDTSSSSTTPLQGQQQHQQQQQQQQQSYLLEGPNIIQQALQTFQTDFMENENTAATDARNDNISAVMKHIMQPQQQLQVLHPLPSPPIAFPFPLAGVTPTFPITTGVQPCSQQQQQQQQQLQWHQALQSLIAVPPQQPAPSTATVNDTSTHTAAAAAATQPFLASLTIPHLIQFNQMQQQLQKALDDGASSTIPIPQILTQGGGCNEPSKVNVVSKLTATKRKYEKGSSSNSSSSNLKAMNDPTTSTARSVNNSTTTGNNKAQKRGLSKKQDSKSSAVISVNGVSRASSVLTGSSTTTSTSINPISVSSSAQQNSSNGINYGQGYQIGDAGCNNNHIDGMDNIQPPKEKSAAVLEKMSAAERRRYDRNLREQQRSYRISQQIKELRDVLQQSNVPFRPNKYSILVSVAEYIQQLQGRAIMLDSEHERLINTIQSTNEAMKSNGDGSNDYGTSSSTSGSDEGHDSRNETNTLFVQGIDYEAAFAHCPYPLGVAALDGRIIAANREFEALLHPNYNETRDANRTTNTTCNSMVDQSFFVFIRNHQEIFEAMAALLKQSTASIECGVGTITKSPTLFFWHGQVVSSRNEIVSTL